METQKQNELRKRAKAMLKSGSDFFPEASDDERRTALHELQTYQIELELQNEDLRRTQQELVETRDQYVDLYDHAPVGYLTLSDKNLIEEANLTLADLLGEERQSLLSQPFSHFIFSDDQDIFYMHFKELVESTTRQACELRMRKKEGDWFWAKLQSVPRAKGAESGFRVRTSLYDITEQKRLETEIMKAKKLEATALLAGGIAHDFNNLLAVILGNLEMVQEDITLARPVSSKKLQQAQEACLRAGELTKKFLTFSSGGEPLKKPTPVAALLSDAVSLPLAGSNVSFESSFADDLRPVDVDAGQITQAIGNVISNARESMPEGGVIRIRAENAGRVPEKIRKILNGRESKYVKVTIQDHGKGIPGDVLPQVFDPYFTSKDTWEKKGLGLGLTITYSIIKKHGGYIEIESKQNTGTTVTLYLPACEMEIALPADMARHTPAVNKKILFMDDEEMLRNVTRDILKMLDCEVELAVNGEEAIQLYAKAQQAGAPFGAVILDLTIKGGMGGKETLQRLKEIDPHVRAIVASGYANDPVMSNFKEYGFLDALFKPYQLKDLAKSLQSVANLYGMLPSQIDTSR